MYARSMTDILPFTALLVEYVSGENIVESLFLLVSLLVLVVVSLLLVVGGRIIFSRVLVVDKTAWHIGVSILYLSPACDLPI